MDLNDLATITTVYADLTLMYNKYAEDQTNMKGLEDIVKVSLVSDQEAKNLLVYFRQALERHHHENIHKHPNPPKSSLLRSLPRHYLESLFILRHMKMRDTKTKLLYVLNFFRSIQKRLALDLREFAGREIVSQNVNIMSP